MEQQPPLIPVTKEDAEEVKLLSPPLPSVKGIAKDGATGAGLVTGGVMTTTGAEVVGETTTGPTVGEPTTDGMAVVLPTGAIVGGAIGETVGAIVGCAIGETVSTADVLVGQFSHVSNTAQSPSWL